MRRKSAAPAACAALREMIKMQMMSSGLHGEGKFDLTMLRLHRVAVGVVINAC